MSQSPPATNHAPITFHVTGMDCADCALILERSVGQLDGVDAVQVNFTSATLEATGTADTERIIERVRALGYDVLTPEERAAQLDAERSAAPLPGGVGGFLMYLVHSRQTALIVVSAALLALSLVVGWLVATPVSHWAAFGLQIAAALIVGYPIALKGIRSLLVGRQVSIDLLMTLAAGGAVLIGQTGEAATVIVLFAVGEALEGYTAERAREFAAQPAGTRATGSNRHATLHRLRRAHRAGCSRWIGLRGRPVPVVRNARTRYRCFGGAHW